MDKPKLVPVARPLLGEEEANAVADVVRSGMIAAGRKVADFEKAFATYVGADHAVATSNATTGLHAALVGLGVGPGDEVIVPAFTFIATANVVMFANATPVFVDVIPGTFAMDPHAFERAITPRTRAVIPVHLFGHPADMKAIKEIADRRGIRILGDAAQAHGTRIGGSRVGTFGDCECFSFYPTKNMTTAEGGIITTNDGALAERIRSFVNHGRSRNELGTYDHQSLGHNYRMTDVHAAIGIVQLAKLDGWNDARRANAARWNRALSGSQIVTPVESSGSHHVYHQYTVRSHAREADMAMLARAGVGSSVYYPKVLYQYPHLKGFASACPQGELAAQQVFSIPVHPGLDAAEIAIVEKALLGLAR